MNIIVTGADGFVGSNVVKRILKEGHNVLAIDISDSPKRLDLSNKNLKYLKSYVNELPSKLDLLSSFNPSIIYHFAWKGSAGPLRCDYNCQIANAVETANLLMLCGKLKCKKFIMAGSIAEFELMDTIYKDGTTPQTSYFYAMGKQLAHNLCKPLAQSLDVELIWAYITNAFGIGEKSPRLINNVIQNIIVQKDFKFSDGTQNYDFLYIDDIAEAFYLLGMKGVKNKGYIIGSGKAKPLKEFIKEIYLATEATSKPIFGALPNTGGNLDIKTFDVSNLINDCGFKPKYSFSEGITLTYKWFKNN